MGRWRGGEIGKGKGKERLVIPLTHLRQQSARRSVPNERIDLCADRTLWARLVLAAHRTTVEFPPDRIERFARLEDPWIGQVWVVLILALVRVYVAGAVRYEDVAKQCSRKEKKS